MDEYLIARATEALRSPAWAAAPDEGDPRFRQVWRQVSMHLQRQLRIRILGDYLADVQRCIQRQPTKTVLVYAASPVYHPDPNGFEFVRDPADPEVVQKITSWMVKRLKEILTDLYPRIQAAGLPHLAARYRPEWSEDIRRDVAQKPGPLIKLVAAEGILIDTIVTLGTDKTRAAVRNFAKLSGRSLKIDPALDGCKIDQAPLYLLALEETGRQLELF